MIYPIGKDCKEGDSVYFVYEHHYNSKSSSERQIPSKFIKYRKNRRMVIIKREDCKNSSRVSARQVFKPKKDGKK